MGVLISFGIVLFISIVIGLVTRWLRNVQQQEEYRQAEARAAERNRVVTRDEVDSDKDDTEVRSASTPKVQRTATTDMERFLEEINKLRNRTAGGSVPQAKPVAVPVAQPVPTVEPTKRVTPTLEQSLPSSPPVVTAPTKLVNLPGVTYNPELLALSTQKPVVVATPLPATPLPVAKPVVGVAVQPDRRKKSELMTQFHSLLKSGRGPALAIMIQEVFGPPKCKQQAPPEGEPTSEKAS